MKLAEPCSRIALKEYPYNLQQYAPLVDPNPQIGNGQSNGTRSNALTILKDGRHGILTNAPKASLHVKGDGVGGSGTIVAVLESSISDRPILQFQRGVLAHTQRIA